MSDFSSYNGYDNRFLGKKLDLPELNERQQNDLAPVEGKDDGIADYINYSLALSQSRRFPYYTAANIDGKLFKKASRADNWRRDPRIADEHQWGKELYAADKSDFDRGHMTKREDVQWGHSVNVATKAADATFYYTNSVPQHANLNQKIWRLLEDYILHQETKERDMRVCVFTGPVLSKKDPRFVTEVQGTIIQIPTLFWKVVSFLKSDGQVYRTGFIMSQESLLRDNDIIESLRKDDGLEAGSEEDDMFKLFDAADTYQVHVPIIEKLSRLTLPPGIDIFKNEKPLNLILKEVEVDAESSKIDELGYEIPNMVLM
jgi:endonuclease G, mitochondrial